MKGGKTAPFTIRKRKCAIKKEKKGICPSSLLWFAWHSCDFGSFCGSSRVWRPEAMWQGAGELKRIIKEGKMTLLRFWDEPSQELSQFPPAAHELSSNSSSCQQVYVSKCRPFTWAEIHMRKHRRKKHRLGQITSWYLCKNTPSAVLVWFIFNSWLNYESAPLILFDQSLCCSTKQRNNSCKCNVFFSYIKFFKPATGCLSLVASPEMTTKASYSLYEFCDHHFFAC